MIHNFTWSTFKKQQHSVGKTSQIITRTTNSEPIHVDYLSTFSSVNIKILAAKTCVMKAVRLFDGHTQAWRFFTWMDLQEVFVVVYPHRHGVLAKYQLFTYTLYIQPFHFPRSLIVYLGFLHQQYLWHGNVSYVFLRVLTYM